MYPEKIFSKGLVVSVLIAMIFSLSSCTPPKTGKSTTIQQTPAISKAAEGVVLSLKFTTGQADTYKSVMETERSGSFTGEIARDEKFKNSKSGTRAEMVFTQQLDVVDDSGNATEKITIKSLKYLTKSRDVVTIDFDSSNPQQQSGILSRLIGQSYWITISPMGEVLGMRGLDEIKQSVDGVSADSPAAVQLVSENLVRKRHQIPAIIDANSRKLKSGDKWSVTKTVTFGIMGDNTFEKIYTLKAIEQKGSRKEAVVDVTGIPATTQTNVPSPLTKMFDTSNSYTGNLVLDLNSGKIEQYREKMQSD